MDAIVDSNVIIHGSKIRNLGEIYTVPGVQKEMKSQDASRKIQNSGINLMKAPELEASKVEQMSDRINSLTYIQSRRETSSSGPLHQHKTHI
jgi:hypothetical protein